MPESLEARMWSLEMASERMVPLTFFVVRVLPFDESIRAILSIPPPICRFVDEMKAYW